MNDNKRQILFIETDPLDHLAKIAKVLKERGYETISLCLMKASSKQKFIDESYDNMINIDLNFFRINFKNLPKIAYSFFAKGKNIIRAYITIKKIKPYIVITRSTPNLLCVISKFIFRKYPIIYYPYDIRSDGYKDLEEIKKAGVKNYEIKCERYCFEKLDGILHKGEDNELNELNTKILGENIKIKAPIFHILPYCMKELIVPINKNKLSKKDGSLHLVYTGCIFDDKRGESFFESIEEILKRKIHLHIYMKHGSITRQEWEKLCGTKYEKFKDNEFYHFHDEMDQESLTKEISKYDYAIWLGRYGEPTITEKKGMGNKFSTYLEAGLPAISFRSYKYISDLGEKYETGIGITFNQIKDLKEMLKKIDYNKMIKNIEKTRSELEIRRHIPNLEKYFEKVIEYKKEN